jgi:hypothetical protein
LISLGSSSATAVVRRYPTSSIRLESRDWGNPVLGIGERKSESERQSLEVQPVWTEIGATRSSRKTPFPIIPEIGVQVKQNPQKTIPVGGVGSGEITSVGFLQLDVSHIPQVEKHKGKDRES